MVVRDFDIFGTSFGPPEADSPLIVDADRVLTASVTLQRLKTIAGRNAQLGQTRYSVDLAELPQGGVLDIGRQAAALFATPDDLGFPFPETPDHVEL
jgi:hypothetical protein